MESYRKNWGRFHFSKKRIRFFFLCIFFSIGISCVFLKYLDARVQSVLKDYLSVEVERITGYVVRDVLKKNFSETNYEDFVYIVRGEDNSIEAINYSNEINNIRNKIAEEVDLEFYNIESGHFEDYFIHQYIVGRDRYKYIRRGFLCELSLNSLLKSVMFGNVGPGIPIKISFIGYSFADILVNVKEYGINNVVLEIVAKVDVNCTISMPVSTKMTKITVKEPIILQIIPGNVPNYYVK